MYCGNVYNYSAIWFLMLYYGCRWMQTYDEHQYAVLVHQCVCMFVISPPSSALRRRPTNCYNIHRLCDDDFFFFALAETCGRSADGQVEEAGVRAAV